MHPIFWPMQVAIFWLDVMSMPWNTPWKMMVAPVADSMKEVVAVTNPAALAGLDPVSPEEIGTNATDFRPTPGESA